MSVQVNPTRPDAPPPDMGEVPMQTAIRDLAALEAWPNGEDRARLRHRIIEDLCVTYWSQGYDEGFESAQDRIRGFLNS